MGEGLAKLRDGARLSEPLHRTDLPHDASSLAGASLPVHTPVRVETRGPGRGSPSRSIPAKTKVDEGRPGGFAGEVISMKTPFGSRLAVPVATALLAVAGVAAPVSAADLASQLALQTWTLRELNFEQVIEFARRHGIKDLQVINKHIDPAAPREDWAKKKAALEAAGLHAYTFGVAGTSMKKEDNRRLFDFAKFMGIKLIIVEPGDFRIWDQLEELAKEYDIRVAVHNHGIKSLYGNPAVVKQVIGHRDSRIGVCLDVGWITSANFDAADVYRKYEGRVFDIHLKDKVVTKTAQGDDVSKDTYIGEGGSNYSGLFAELKKSGYTGRLAIETDSGEFAKSPDAFVQKAKVFVEASSK